MKRIHMMILAGALALLAGLSLAAEPGLYFEPSEPGWGLSLNQGSAGYAVTVYTYSPTGDQAWVVSDTGSLGDQLDLFAPSGLFPAALHELGDPVGAVSVIAIDDERIRLTYRIDLWDNRCTGRPQPGPLPPVCQGSFALTRLAD